MIELEHPEESDSGTWRKVLKIGNQINDMDSEFHAFRLDSRSVTGDRIADSGARRSRISLHHSGTVDAARLHILKSALAVRELPISQNQHSIQRATANAQPCPDTAMSALLLENGAILFEGYAKGASRETASIPTPSPRA